MTKRTLSLILATSSLLIFAFAAWVGFVPLDTEHYNEYQWENRLKEWTNENIFEPLNWDWPIKERYALTKIGLIIATISGVTAIWLQSQVKP